MTPKLYMTEISPSCRAVLLTARVLGVTLELREIDLSNNEQLSPSFVKINPQHTVPTLEDNGFVIWDSHAIIAFLVGKYGKDDSLYCREVFQRALIDQRLHFDSAVMTSFTRNILNPILYENTQIDIQYHETSFHETYELMEKFLRCKPWIAGNALSIADLSLIPSITSLNVAVPIDETKFPNLTAWIRRAECLPCYVANQNGLNKLKALLDSRRIN